MSLAGLRPDEHRSRVPPRLPKDAAASGARHPRDHDALRRQEGRREEGGEAGGGGRQGQGQEEEVRRVTSCALCSSRDFPLEFTSILRS